MPRTKDIAWKFVIRQGKKWHCPYCNVEFSGSVTRVRSHFLRRRRDGIVHCQCVPSHICKLLKSLRNPQIRGKDHIAWKFVNKLEDNKWRCRYCRGEFSGDLDRVKDHLLGVPNQGINICTAVPDQVSTLMRRLLLDEVAEEESRGANGQSSLQPRSHATTTQPEVAEEESRGVNGQSSLEPESHGVIAQAELAVQGTTGDSYQALSNLELLLSEEPPQPESFPQDSLEEMCDQFLNCLHEGHS